jgi:predicted dehydrogenase
LSLLRGVISGFGEVAAQAHLPGWRECDRVSVMAIHDPIAARRHAAINLRANLRVYDDLALMLDGESPEFADITSPPAYHAEAARMALEAGAHVLVEKPLCLDAAEFERLAALAKARQRVLMCVHNWHFAPAYREAYELIAAGRLGELHTIFLIRLRSQPAGATLNIFGGDSGAAPLPSAERWRTEAKTGGGILSDHGWHVFYLIHRLMGLDAGGMGLGAPDERHIKMSAHLGYRSNSMVDDLADLRITWPSGRLANVNLSWRSPARRTSATIYGDRGLLEIESDRVVLTGHNGAVEDHSVADAPDDSYHRTWFAGLAIHFLDAIAEGADGPIVRQNHAEIRFALAATSAARESSAGGGIPVALAQKPA